ncbi:thioredoxin family protein [Paraburkholderia caffeinilytica]|uniref:thioredoxin family protein n=1 Tax=Paraburkholderia caffeinilytica TaxID=1761016 RepID=UPI0038B7074D
MTITDTTLETFDADSDCELPVLVDFWAPWCGPCLALAPSVEQLAADYEGRLKVLKLNTTGSEDACNRFNIRGIPTLVFYRKGEEVGRCTGPSTIRLRTMVGKWLGESGLDVPVRTDELSALPVESATQSEHIWRSFGASEDIKAACVTRWSEAPATPESRPSLVLSGAQKDGQFEASVGAPADFGLLLDMLWDVVADWDNPTDENPQAHAQMLEWIEALPVGVNLSSVTAAVLYDFMHKSPWDVSQYFDGDAHDLATRIKLLHTRENAGEKIPISEWQSLQREAVLLIGKGSEQEDRISRSLESLTIPLNEESASYEIFTIIRLLFEKNRNAENLPIAEVLEIEEIQRKNESQASADLGDQPEDAAGSRAWLGRYFEHVRLLNQQSRVQYPELWLRHDALVARKKDTSRQIAAYLFARLMMYARAAGTVTA